MTTIETYDPVKEDIGGQFARAVDPAAHVASVVNSIPPIVQFRLDAGPSTGEWRNAIVVRAWLNNDPSWDGREDQHGAPPPTLNMQVFTDSIAGGQYNDALPPVMWRTGVKHGNDIGCWRYLPR